MSEPTVVTPPAGLSDLRARVLDYGVYVALALVVVFNAVFTDNFLTIDSLRLQVIQVAPVVIVSLGMALVIGTEGIDLSVGAVMAVAAAVLPLYLGYGPWVAVVVALVASALVGLLNGGMVGFLGIQPIVATLGLLVAGRGIALVIAGGRLTELFDPGLQELGRGRVAGLPYTGLIALALTLAVAGVVRYTAFGRHLVAIGGNRRGARLAGLPVTRTLVLVYVISAVLAGLAGVLETARTGASNPSFVGLLVELSAITAVVVGGTPLTGGRIRILGTVAGALLMQMIIATLIRQNLDDSYARMVQAAVIVGAVYIQRTRGAE
jgi:galactofuranose transport system permease protein